MHISCYSFKMQLINPNCDKHSNLCVCLENTPKSEGNCNVYFFLLHPVVSENRRKHQRNSKEIFNG